MILAPLVKGRKGLYQDLFTQLRRDGFIRVRVDGEVHSLEEKEIKLAKYKNHSIEVVVDRIRLDGSVKKRLTDSVETALHAGKGTLIIAYPGDDGSRDQLYSERNACLKCDLNFEELAPRAFSFNSPYGACPACDGLGNKIEIDPELLVPDKSEPLITAIRTVEERGKGDRPLLPAHAQVCGKGTRVQC
jgi:excinuclease ABC subunit A